MNLTTKHINKLTNWTSESSDERLLSDEFDESDEFVPVSVSFSVSPSIEEQDLFLFFNRSI